MNTQKYIRLSDDSVILFPIGCACTLILKAYEESEIIKPISGGLMQTEGTEVTCKSVQAAIDKGLKTLEDDALIIHQQLYSKTVR